MGNCGAYLLCTNTEEDPDHDYFRPSPSRLSFLEDLAPVQEPFEVLQNTSVIEDLSMPVKNSTPFKRSVFRRTLSSANELENIIPINEIKPGTEKFGFQRSNTRTFTNGRLSFLGRVRRRSTLIGGNFRYDGYSDESTCTIYHENKENLNGIESSYICKHSGDSEPCF